jgi:hypothetical protein
MKRKSKARNEKALTVPQKDIWSRQNLIMLLHAVIWDQVKYLDMCKQPRSFWNDLFDL